MTNMSLRTLMIPSFTIHGFLPAGQYVATLSEVESRFGMENRRRRSLMSGLRRACAMFVDANIDQIYIDGSFITDKEEPNDVDGCFGATDRRLIQWKKIDPVFFREQKTEMIRKYGLDFYFATEEELQSGVPFFEYFQKTSDGLEKGIVIVNLKTQEQSL